MNVDPRVQKFYDEAAAAKRELRRLAIDIAAHRLDMVDTLMFHPATQRVQVATSVVAEVTWALENGRTDLAARIIELVDQYNNSMGTAEMMVVRVNSELHQKAVRAQEEGDHPDYLEGDENDAPVIRLSPAQAQNVFSPVEAEED